MKNEAKLDLLSTFVEHRAYIFNLQNLPKGGGADNFQGDDRKLLNYSSLLMNLPVSKLSKFSDPIWDFNSDYPNAAQNVKGAKLRINFKKYEDIPKFVLTEIKIIFELALLNNSIFKFQNKLKKEFTKSIIKANTLISIFESGLSFFNELFKQAALELGYEFVQAKIQTLSDVYPEHYFKAALNYDRVRGPALNTFFKYLRSSAAREFVFSKPIAYVELDSLTWIKSANTSKTKEARKQEEILPDLAFESLSKVTSFIVIDFLNQVGKSEYISDEASLKRFNASEYSSWAKSERINNEVLNAYTAIRLRNKNHDPSAIMDLIEIRDWMKDKNSVLYKGPTLRKVLAGKGYTLDSLRQYINLVAYSCIYLVGQYTGMRPSELAEVNVQECSCLTEEDGVWLIKSSQKKHIDETSTGLFDDKWVAIPIVKDAILAASLIAKIKASPYLLSNVDTNEFGAEPSPMKSIGIKHQMDKLIEIILGEDAVKEICFYTYMLRHTLSYQLFRAEVGLPLISFQLKHFVDSVSKYTSIGSVSSVTLGYGEIGEALSKDGTRADPKKSFRRAAELDVIKTVHDPNGVYYGGKAEEHKKRLAKTFQGYIAEGYTEEEVYQAMVDQGVAVAYVGQGLCYGGREEEYDASLPCIGSLRCNPARCKQAVVTSKHAPKWREVYILNKSNLDKPEYSQNRTQIEAAMGEAKMVLESLGEKVEL